MSKDSEKKKILVKCDKCAFLLCFMVLVGLAGLERATRREEIGIIRGTFNMIW
jgi:hypothetical protein